MSQSLKLLLVMAHMMMPYNGRLLLEFKKKYPTDFLQQKVFTEKDGWSVLCNQSASSVLYFVLVKSVW